MFFNRGAFIVDTYDVLVLSAAMGEGHIPTVGLVEMIRVVKPGTDDVLNM